MVSEVLERQAKARAEQTGELLEEALATVLKTEAGIQLQNLRNSAHADERADEWQQGAAKERAEERADMLGWRSRPTKLRTPQRSIAEAEEYE